VKRAARGVFYPCVCLCFGFSQITITLPLRLMILHFSQIGFTDDLTFIFYSIVALSIHAAIAAQIIILL